MLELMTVGRRAVRVEKAFTTLPVSQTWTWISFQIWPKWQLLDRSSDLSLDGMVIIAIALTMVAASQHLD
jgi:hypothetical protein